MHLRLHDGLFIPDVEEMNVFQSRLQAKVGMGFSRGLGFRPGDERLISGFLYPLTAPAVRPAINCLAAMKVKMIAGSATRVPMAVMLPHSTPVSVK